MASLALNPQYDAIGKGFVQQYYALFDDPAQRPNLANMYNVSLTYLIMLTLLCAPSSLFCLKIQVILISATLDFKTFVSITAKMVWAGSSSEGLAWSTISF